MTLFVFRKAYPKGPKGIKEESVFKHIESSVQEVYLFYVSLKYTWLMWKHVFHLNTSVETGFAFTKG